MSNLRCARWVNSSVAFALAVVGGTIGCGVGDSGGNIGGTRNTGGNSTIGSPTGGATCGEANPAAQTCRKLPDQCIPTECWCLAYGEWACSVACLPNLPLCSTSGIDGGGADSGTNATKHPDATIDTSAPDPNVREAGAGDSSKDSVVSSSGSPCEDPCCGDPCCGDPCCGDPCCGQSCIGDPCGGDPCCGDPCCGDACCGDPCCGDACCGDPCCGNCWGDWSDLSVRLHAQFSSINDRAAYNLTCSTGQVTLEHLGDHRYRATGCGKMSFYQCFCVGGDSLDCSTPTCRAESGVIRDPRDN